MEEEDARISDETDEEIEDPTYIEVRKITDKFKQHNAPGIDGTTSLYKKLALHYGTEFTNRLGMCGKKKKECQQTGEHNIPIAQARK